MNKRIIFYVVIAIILSFSLYKTIINKIPDTESTISTTEAHNDQYEISLLVDEDKEYTVRIINLNNDGKMKEIGTYQAKDKKITMSLDFIPKLFSINYQQLLFIVETNNKIGVGVYTNFSLNEPNEIHEQIYSLYKEEYYKDITIHFYDKTTNKDFDYSTIMKNKILKAQYNEENCIKIGYGAYMTTGYDEYGDSIGHLFSINNHTTLGMSNCKEEYNGINITHNFLVKEFKLSNAEQEINFVIPIEWLHSLTLDKELGKNEYTTYILKETTIKLHIQVYQISYDEKEYNNVVF